MIRFLGFCTLCALVLLGQSACEESASPTTPSDAANANLGPNEWIGRLHTASESLSHSDPITAYGSRYDNWWIEWNAELAVYLHVCVNSSGFRPDIRFSRDGRRHDDHLEYDGGGIIPVGNTQMTRILGPISFRAAVS